MRLCHVLILIHNVEMSALILDAVYIKAGLTVSNAANAFSMLLHQSNKYNNLSCGLRRHPLFHPLLDI